MNSNRKSSFSVQTLDTLRIPRSDLILIIREILEKGLNLKYRATGNSMTPSIKDQEIVTIHPCGPEISIGDIVVFHDCNFEHLVIHRVIGRKNQGYVIKGDAAFSDDGVIHHKQIMGRVKEIEATKGRIRIESCCNRKATVWLSKLRFFYCLKSLYRIPQSFQSRFKKHNE